MTEVAKRDLEADLVERGFSRRQVTRISALMGAGAVLASAGVPVWAQQRYLRPPANSNLRLGSNECWVGPFASAVEAVAGIVGQCNYYSPHAEGPDFVAAVSEVDGVPQSHVAPWPGSSDPLSRTVIAFCAPGKGLVTADPSYELPWTTAEWMGVKVTKTPLTADYRHDVKAMLAADPNAGVYYICSPNNPTGTITPLEDIEWLVANKPAGSIVVVDEAYIHFSHTKSAAGLVAQDKDVIVLRTFSKLFGMAGVRLGISMARPDLHEKMFRYDGAKLSRNTPVPALVCGTVSMKQKGLIAARKAEMIATREKTFAHMKMRGVSFIPSDANMFMVDWKKPAKEVAAQFAAQGITIGRSWPIWPTVSRVTVGSATEMQTFTAVLDKILA